MKILIIIFTLCLIPGGTGAVITVTGYRGVSVQIRCSYRAGYETKKKYLCRGDHFTQPWKSKDIPVQSDSDPEDKRFSLYDNTADKVFIITIADLRPEDAGIYWCGIERNVLDVFTEVELLVKTESSGVALYSFIIAGFTLIATGVITVIYCNIKSRGEKMLPQTSRDANEDQENDRSLFSLQSRENPDVSDSVYQNFRTLTPQTSQSDSVYQIMNSNTHQSCTVGQTVKSSNSRSDSVYQATPAEATQSDSVYQIMSPQNNLSDSASHLQTP